MAEPRVAAVIQARMGSSRLPGKVLMPLAGKPILWHIVHRLRKCRNVDVVAIATSNLPIDDPLVSFAASLDVPLIRGSEDNVLSRFALAAEVLDADYLVRVTGDAPLVDPETIDLLVRELIAQKADYCVGVSAHPTIHEGFDPFSCRALQRLSAEASDDPVAREHVTAYFKSHPDFGYTVRVDLPAGYEIEDVRASVDTPSDLLFLETVYQRLGAPAGDIDVRQVVELLKKAPELKRINAHVRQKDTTRQYVRMLIRCDGNPRLGIGHVVRCLALAGALRDRHGIGLSFALGEEGIGADLVRRENYPVFIRPQGQEEALWIEDLIQKYSPSVLVLDIRTDLDASVLSRWRAPELKVVVIDDPSERRLAADLVFYPPVPQLDDVDWSGFTGEAFIGLDYLLLRPEFSLRRPRPDKSPPVLLVTMGGSDPGGLTLLALEALRRLDLAFTAQVVLGPAFLHREALERLRPLLPSCVRFEENVSDMPGLMASADLAVAAFGGTAYELAALGVPSLLLGLTPDHARSAEALTASGMAVSLGFYRQVTAQGLAEAITELVKDAGRRRQITAACSGIDGRGVERVANIIVERSISPHG